MNSSLISEFASSFKNIYNYTAERKGGIYLAKDERLGKATFQKNVPGFPDIFRIKTNLRLP